MSDLLVVEFHDVVLSPDPGADVRLIGEAQGPAGPRGPAGPPGLGYDHIQASPSATWTINHNLGHRLGVQCFTVGGVDMLGSIQHVSDNQVIVTFAIPVAGYARLT